MAPNQSWWRAVWFLSFVLGLLLLLWVPVSQGQTTSITSSGLNTNVTLSVGAPVPTYNITGGTRPSNGTNLFHSFGDFSVGTHDRAVFQNDSGRSTTNILSRVTGGHPSNIFGNISTTTFPGANLFLINPAGIVFGPSASLNVGGSVHFSTADYLRLGSGNDRFYADLGKTSQLTSAEVTAFGFLGEGAKGPITVQAGNPLAVSEGKGISLIGGDISITGRTLSAPGGQINVASVKFAAEALVNPTGQSSGLKVVPSPQSGQTPEQLQATPAEGTVLIRGGALVGTVTLGNNAVLKADGVSGGKVGNIDIEAKTLNMSPGSLISASTSESAKDVNSLVISASGLIRISSATIESGRLDSGNQANVTITSPGLVALTDGAMIKTNVSMLGEQAGNISIQSGQLVMDNSQIMAVNSAAGGGEPGNITSGGDITLTATSMNLSNSRLENSTSGNTKAGSMTLRGQDIVLQNSALVGASRLSLNDVVVVPTGGKAGSVTIEGINGPAQNVTLSNSSMIETDIQTAGNPGNLPADIKIISQAVTLTDHAQISAISSGEASAGNIRINTNQLTMTNGAMISSNSTRTDGPAGGAGAILIGGVHGNISLDNSSISSTISGGNELLISSGNIDLFAQTIRLTNGALITAATSGDTPAGSIILNVGNLATSSGAMVSSSSTSTGTSAGSAGEIVIQGAQGESSFAKSVTLDDSIFSITSKGGKFKFGGSSGQPGHISLLAQSISLENGTRIETDSSGGGFAGNILFQGSGAGIGNIATTNFATSNGVRISANSTGTADAGNILVSSGNIFIGDSTVSTSATQASGGNIRLVAPNMVRLTNVQLTSSVSGSTTSDAGNISINTVHPQFVVISNSEVSANANEGQGGNIFIAPQYQVIQGNSRLLAKAGAGIGGRIDIIASRAVLIEPGSELNASAGPAGVSGTINVQAPIQQLSGAIAPLPQAFAVATNLYGQRCAAEKGGQFSSFVQGARDGVPPQPGDLIPSPLLLELDEVPFSSSSQSTPSLSASRLGLPEFEQTSHGSVTIFAGCRS